MRTLIKSCVAITILTCALVLVRKASPQNPSKSVLLEVVRSSWDVQRSETLVYLRVYSNGFAEAHPTKKLDLRDVEYKKKQLSADELAGLSNLLADPATDQLSPEYSRYWGNKDFGYEYDVTISDASHKQIKLVNFDPFLARKQGKPYPKQLEKLGCSIWKLRAEVSAEPLEKDWLKGCSELGY